MSNLARKIAQLTCQCDTIIKKDYDIKFNNNKICEGV